MLKYTFITSALFAHALAAKQKPEFPESYTAVVSMQLPYAGIDIPLKFTVDNKNDKESIDYYQGLQTDYFTKDGIAIPITK